MSPTPGHVCDTLSGSVTSLLDSLFLMLTEILRPMCGIPCSMDEANQTAHVQHSPKAGVMRCPREKGPSFFLYRAAV